jgi:DNA-directed RNA polymerase specialized sigma24 family protein
MHDLERIVDELALKAKSYPKGSKDRLKYLTKLTNAILQSQPSCQNRYQLPYSIYRELQDEAIQETFIRLYKKIDEYDPAQGHILHWFRETLRYRFLDLCDKYVMGRLVQENNKKKRVRDESLDQPVYQNNDPSSTTPLDKLEQPETAHPRHREYEKLRELIEQDPTGKFRQAHVEKREEVTFQVIALGRIDERSWNDLSEQWNIKVSVLSSFYQRSIQRFKPIFRDYLDI